MTAQGKDSDDVLTIANQLTLLRMLLIPAFIVLTIEGELGWALAVFALAFVLSAILTIAVTSATQWVLGVLGWSGATTMVLTVAGILVAFLAGHTPIAILPVAILLGGISASGGLLQRTFGLPDAAVNVLQGILFVVLLGSQTYRGRLRLGRA